MTADRSLRARLAKRLTAQLIAKVTTKTTAALAVLLLAAACASSPKPADWQLEAKGALDRALAAYLEGNSRVEALEFARAKTEISSTGKVNDMARAELLRCASRVASLVFEPCAGFDTLRVDAGPAERAYATYLLGTLPLEQFQLLPERQQRAMAVGSSGSSGNTGGSGAAAAATADDALSQLVATGVAFQAGKADLPRIRQAVETASGQGWRRPLLAWLGVQLALAEKSGEVDEAARLRRRIALARGDVKAAAPAPAVP